MSLLVLYYVYIFFFHSLSMISFVIFFFFFKQKTAYEVRISDWSSDVCSSDLSSGDTGKAYGAASGRVGSPWSSHANRAAAQRNSLGGKESPINRTESGPINVIRQERDNGHRRNLERPSFDDAERNFRNVPRITLLLVSGGCCRSDGHTSEI